jgi:hypothetical protein
LLAWCRSLVSITAQLPTADVAKQHEIMRWLQTDFTPVLSAFASGSLCFADGDTAAVRVEIQRLKNCHPGAAAPRPASSTAQPGRVGCGATDLWDCQRLSPP